VVKNPDDLDLEATGDFVFLVALNFKGASLKSPVHPKIQVEAVALHEARRCWEETPGQIDPRSRGFRSKKLDASQGAPERRILWIYWDRQPVTWSQERTSLARPGISVKETPEVWQRTC